MTATIKPAKRIAKGACAVRRAGTALDRDALQRAIFNSRNFSSIATDAMGVIQIFNVGAEQMLGYSAAEVTNTITPADISDSEEIVGRAGTLSAEFGTPIAPGFEALVYKAARGIEDIYELTYIRKDGSRFPAIVSVTALRDAEEAIIGYLLIGTDNTARKQVEDERMKLAQQNAALQDGSRMKSEFLANMSHELRTPLNAIIGFSELMCDGVVGGMTPQQSAFVDNIFTSGRHLLALINDILDLSKVEAGKMALELESIEVSPLLMSCLSIVRERAASQQIRLALSSKEEMGRMEMDPRRVKQIIYNLLSNAVKFSSHGGQVTLRTAMVSRSEVGAPKDGRPGRTFPLPNNDFENFLKISVSDSGIGISRADMAQLFKPFSQIDGRLARKFEGTGLGLAMVKLLAELHGGTVAVESAIGQGSTFTVWIPRRSPESSTFTMLADDVQDVAPTSGARVALIVEDDPKSAELIRAQLEAEGFVVVHAPTAESALEMALKLPLSLITLDIMLPNMDGWELLGRFKQIPELQRVPVVMISIVADRSKGFALGAAAVMQKPISRKELHDSLADIGVLPIADGRKLKVLIVDDDPKSVELIASHVADLASEVLRVYSGKDAIDIARSALPDLIFLDLMMPGVNGFDVANALQADSRTARIPILVVTAKPITAEDRARLHGYVSVILEKGEGNQKLFAGEIRRAMAGRSAAA